MATPLKKLPVNAQFKLEFAAPLVDDYQVTNLTTLLTLDASKSYQHKLVWVISEKSYYYLTSGDGSQLWHWTQYTADFTIEQWNNTNQYNLGNIVYLNQKIYKVTNAVTIGESPEASSNWTCIAGQTQSQRFTFSNLSTVTFVTNIANPMFQIYTGDLVLNSGTPVLDNYGYPEIENETLTSVGVYKRTDIAFSSGYTYEFSFNSGSTTTAQSGIVIVK